METYKNGVEDIALLTYETYASCTKVRWLKMEIFVCVIAFPVATILENGFLFRLILFFS